MSEQVGDYLLGRLNEWGIRRIYGYPGDGINGIVGAIDRAGDRIEFIQARHEEMAAFMACAHAKFTGQVGVCLATSGPGGIHLLNGLYDAQKDHQPVVAIVGQQKRMGLGGDYQQEIDLSTLFKDVAHEYCQVVMSPVQMRHVIDRAVRIAAAKRTVTCVIVPNDIQEMDAVESPPQVHGAVFSGVGYSSPRVVPYDDDLNRAASVLNNGERVAMLIGAGALQATEEVMEVAEVLGAGVAKALLGKAALPDDLPYVTGAIGLLGTRPSYELMTGCDTLLMIGSNFPYAEWMPAEGQARGVQIDIEPARLSYRYPMEVALTGEAGATLRELLPKLQPKSDRSWREHIEAEVRDWWQVLEERAMTAADPVNPQRVFWELSPRLPDDAIVTADSGSVANWYARDLRIRRGMMASLSGGLATMGPGVPYAIAAKFAFPHRPVIALVGDGAMQMNGNSELLTAAKYWRRWGDGRFMVMVLNNQDLNQVTWEQRAMAGDPKFEGSQNLPDFSYAKYAELLGFKGISVRDPGALGEAWSDALAADRPTLLEVHADPSVPPLPPHIQLEQAKAYIAALWKGDPDRSEVVRQSAREIVAPRKPGRRQAARKG